MGDDIGDVTARLFVGDTDRVPSVNPSAWIADSLGDSVPPGETGRSVRRGDAAAGTDARNGEAAPDAELVDLGVPNKVPAVLIPSMARSTAGLRGGIGEAAATALGGCRVGERSGLVPRPAASRSGLRGRSAPSHAACSTVLACAIVLWWLSSRAVGPRSFRTNSDADMRPLTDSVTAVRPLPAMDSTLRRAVMPTSGRGWFSVLARLSRLCTISAAELRFQRPSAVDSTACWLTHGRLCAAGRRGRVGDAARHDRSGEPARGGGEAGTPSGRVKTRPRGARGAERRVPLTCRLHGGRNVVSL